MMVWAATIEHKGGTNLYLESSKSALDSTIFAFVCYWWDTEFETPIPENKDDAIAEYFERIDCEFLTRFEEQEVI